MWALIQTHPMSTGAALMLLVTNAIGALPTPKDNSSQLYEWFFKFMTGLLGGFFRLIAIYKPDWMAAMGQPPKQTIPPNPPVAQT
jgi:hypothetical protein